MANKNERSYGERLADYATLAARLLNTIQNMPLKIVHIEKIKLKVSQANIVDL